MSKVWASVIFSAVVIAAPALAADAPQAQRKILQRQPVAGTDKESVIGTAELPPGVAIGRHSHPGEEVGYVLQGPLVLKMDGQPDKVLQAGESYAVPRGVVHDAVGHGGGGAKVVGVWIIDRGAALSAPAR